METNEVTDNIAELPNDILTPDGVYYEYEIKKRNRNNTGWRKVKYKLPCITNDDEYDENTEHERLEKLIKEKSGNGIYKLKIFDQNNIAVDLPEVRLEIGVENNTREALNMNELAAEKENSATQILKDEIEHKRLERVLRSIDDDDDEKDKENEYAPNIALYEEIADLKAELKEKLENKPSTGFDSNMIIYMMNQQNRQAEQTRIEMQRQAQENQKMMMQLMNKPGPNIADIATAFMPVIQQLLEPKKNDDMEMFKMLLEQKSATEQAMPQIIENAMQTTSKFTEKSAEILLKHITEPSPKDKATQTLNLWKGIIELTTPPIKEFIAITQASKIKANPPNTTTQTQMQTQQEQQKQLERQFNEMLVFIGNNMQKEAKEIAAHLIKTYPTVAQYINNIPDKNLIITAIEQTLNNSGFNKDGLMDKIKDVISCIIQQ